MNPKPFLSILRLAGVVAGCFVAFCATLSHAAQRAELGGWLQVDATRLKPEALELVEHALRKTDRLALGPSRGGVDYFALLFGGTNGTDVTRYLRERVHYLGKDTDEGEDPSDNASTYAYNYGPSWLELIYKQEVLGQARARPTSAPFRQGKIAITSPRTGLIILGGAFMDKGTTAFDRMETFVHEARHSDCAAKPSHRDLEAYMKDKYLEISQEGQACTHLHMPCPAGHALAGELACDAHPWGGYMVGYVFAEEVFKRCKGCNEFERQQALVTAKEDFTRLAPELREKLKSGTLPAPVMESLP
jgi:hypothetical protein